MHYSMSPVTPASDVPQGIKDLFVEYAGFWSRVAASLIDGLVLFIATLPINFLFGYGLLPQRPQQHNFFGEGSPENWTYLEYTTLTAIISWLYFSLMESSRRQATPGKMALGILVTDEFGNRITFGRATGRFFSKVISYITLTIGFMMAGWTRKKQALHDIMARTLVVRK
jgi:uncharacterized RDD family membrane protein YckC